MEMNIIGKSKKIHTKKTVSEFVFRTVGINEEKLLTTQLNA